MPTRNKPPSQVPAPRRTMEVDAAWLEGDANAPSAPGKRPPQLPTVREMPAAKRRTETAKNAETVAEMAAVNPPEPPSLKASAARHHTMEVDATWLEANDVEKKLRNSLAPLPPPADTKKAALAGLSREEPEEETSPNHPARRATVQLPRVNANANAASASAKKTAASSASGPKRTTTSSKTKRPAR